MNYILHTMYRLQYYYNMYMYILQDNLHYYILQYHYNMNYYDNMNEGGVGGPAAGRHDGVPRARDLMG